VHCRCSELETLFWLLFRWQGQESGQFDGDMVINLMPTDFDSPALTLWEGGAAGIRQSPGKWKPMPLTTLLWAWQMREKFEHLFRVGKLANLGAYELCYAICQGTELPWTGALGSAIQQIPIPSHVRPPSRHTISYHKPVLETDSNYERVRASLAARDWAMACHSESVIMNSTNEFKQIIGVLEEKGIKNHIIRFSFI